MFSFRNTITALIAVLLRAGSANAQVPVRAGGSGSGGSGPSETLFGTTAATSADNTADPTTGKMFTFPMVFDGSTWDRWTGAVTCSNCSGSGASKVDGANWGTDTDSVAPSGFLYDTTPGALTDGDVGLARMSADRYLYAIFPSAQSVSAAQSGAWNITNVSGTVSLPTGAATAANQSTEITALQLLDNIVSGTGVNVSQVNGVTPLMGNGATGTGSNRVTLANDNTIPTGWPTAANQTTLHGYVDGLETLIGTTNTNTAAALTSANFAAAFGTAGTADTQVMSVQGIASGVALTVAPSSGSFATDAVFGTATYTEATTTGPVAGAVRNDTLDSLANTTNEIAPLAVNSLGALYVANTASTSGGADSLKYTSVGSTEDEHTVKASAGTLYSITATNTNAAVRYIRCENDTAANTTPGSETPEIDLAIPGATTGAGITFAFPAGVNFSAGITCWLVTGAADTDVTEVAANEIKVFYSYK